MSEISVIIPVYNGEKTILSTLESVLNQTFTDLEIIIVNDGSSDASLDIISKIQDPRIKVFSYQNSGISISRNRGISHASVESEFIAFIDHDDLWSSDKLELQVEALRNNPEAAVAYSWINFIDKNNQLLYELSRPSMTGNVFPKLIINNFLTTASNPLIRKQALTQVGGFDESIFGPEDWDLFLQLALHYQFVLVPKVQVLFRVSVGSASSNVSRQEVQSLKVIEKVFGQAPQSLQYLKKCSLSNLYVYLAQKALEAPKQKSSLIATRYIWQAIKFEPALIVRKSILKVIFKSSSSSLIFLLRNLSKFSGNPQ